MRHIILGLLIAGCLAPAALGDILYLRDGRKIEGKIVFEANGIYHVEVRSNNIKAKMKISKYEVVRIVKQAKTTYEKLMESHSTMLRATEKAATISAWEDLAAWCAINKLKKQKKDALLRAMSLRQKEVEKSNTADDWFGLGTWCRQNGLMAEAKRCYQRALLLDANHKPTRSALGHKLVQGAWMTPEEHVKFEERAMRLKGYIKWEGKWHTPEAVQALVKLKEQKTRQEITELRLAQDKVIKQLFELQAQTRKLAESILAMQRERADDKAELRRLSRRLAEQRIAFDRTYTVMSRRIATLERQVRELQTRK